MYHGTQTWMSCLQPSAPTCEEMPRCEGGKGPGCPLGLGTEQTDEPVLGLPPSCTRLGCY